MRAPIILAAALLLLSPAVNAQTKGETSQYAKIVKKPTVKAAEKFLKKFPESVYAPKVIRLRDSLEFYALDPDDAPGIQAFAKDHPNSPFMDKADERIKRHNTSTISREDALAKAGDCLDAMGWRKDNKDHIIVLDKDLTVRVLSPDGSPEYSHSIPVYTMDGGAISLASGLENTAPLGRRYYIHFAYMNGADEYVEVLYSPEEDIVHQAMFYGKAIGGVIEGQSPEDMEGLQPSAEVSWISARMKENPTLVPITKANLLTDESIKWWLEQNPKAQTSATKLVFGLLDKESSIVEACRKASKEKGKSYNAATFDIRGYTVVCAVNRKSGEYLLVWCEPVCKNKKTGKYLSTIYFDNDETTLSLCYYQKNKILKTKISMATQAVKR